jgi:precorrin-2 methylase
MMIRFLDWARRHRAQVIAGFIVIGMAMLYAFYHTIRWSVDQRHATAWMAVQTVATIAAFTAAAIYARIAHRQTTAIARQTALAEKDYIERNKPIVLLDRWEHPEKEGNYHYVLRNVGGGFALNVYYFERADDNLSTTSRYLKIDQKGMHAALKNFEKARDGKDTQTDTQTADAVPSTLTADAPKLLQ